MELILFLAIVFLFIFLFGLFFEKIRVPWVFTALLLGLCLAFYNPFNQITSLPEFNFLANMGMYFLLFIIGFELNIKHILNQGKFIFQTTFAIILTETFFGTILIHFLFNTPWLTSILVASSFATIGEAVLLPILEEFKLLKTHLGQTILGIGVLDNFIEILTIIFASILVGKQTQFAQINLPTTILVILFLLTTVVFSIKFHKKINHFKFKDHSLLFLFLLVILFLFVGIGNIVDSSALGALIAGIVLKNIIPKKNEKIINATIKTITYGFFAPIFFLQVGLRTNINYLLTYPILVILIMLLTKATKLGSSYLMTHKKLGTKQSFILGISMCVKFSTSIVIIKYLFDNQLISSELYSILVGSSIAFKFLVPFLLSYLIPKWKISKQKDQTITSTN